MYADGTFLKFSRVGAFDLRLAWDLPYVRRLVIPKENVKEAKRQLEVLREEKEGPRGTVKKRRRRRLKLIGVSSVLEAIDKVFLDRPVDEASLLALLEPASDKAVLSP